MVHLITHERVKRELQGEFPDRLDTLHFISESWIDRLVYSLGRRLPDRVYTWSAGLLLRMLSQVRARRLIRELSHDKKFDLVYMPSPVSVSEPCFLGDSGVPYIIGPMQGGMEFPPGMEGGGLISRATIRALRFLARAFHTVFNDKSKAKMLLFANQRSRDAYPGRPARNMILFCDNGVDTALWKPKKAFRTSPKEPYRLIWVGRLVHWKRVDIAIRALSRVKIDAVVTLEIVGEGSERASLEKLVAQYQLQEKVLFKGWKSQDEIAEIVNQSDTLLLPSLYESGGAVVLEALSSQVPVIATRWGGPAEYLAKGGGILVEPKSEEALIDGFAEAITRLALDPALAIEMGEKGRVISHSSYDWNHRVTQLLEIFRS